MKLHHIFGAACVLGGTLALSSCEKYDELFPAQYHCVLNIKDAGIRNTELYTTEAEGPTLVSIMKTGCTRQRNTCPDGRRSFPGLLHQQRAEICLSACRILFTSQ